MPSSVSDYVYEVERSKTRTCLVNQRCAELVGGNLGVGIGAHAKDTQLHALDWSPNSRLCSLHGKIGKAASDVYHD